MIHAKFNACTRLKNGIPGPEKIKKYKYIQIYTIIIYYYILYTRHDVVKTRCSLLVVQFKVEYVSEPASWRIRNMRAEKPFVHITFFPAWNNKPTNKNKNKIPPRVSSSRLISQRVFSRMFLLFTYVHITKKIDDLSLHYIEDASRQKLSKTE